MRHGNQLIGRSRAGARLVVLAALVLAACAPAAPSSKPSAGAATPSSGQTAAPASQPAPSGQQAPAGQPASSGAAPQAPIASNEPPRRGGELTFVVSAEPPSFDGHRESSFAMLHWTAPHYSLLLKFDPNSYPKIVGDVADSWDISADGLTYTFKLRDGVKFHDGSTLTARDVKATYDHIIAPPQGVVSARRAAYSGVDGVEAPDDRTVVFRLKYPQAAMLALLASPWNYVYKAERLETDPRWYEKNILGTGPFKFLEYVPGSHWVGQRFDDYFDKPRPHLDGFRAIFIRDPSAQVAAIRGGRAQAEFRGFAPPQRDDLVRAMGKDVVVQESAWDCSLYVVLNTERKPFDDVRVRRALTLALDRWNGVQALSQIAFVKEVGGIQRPGAPFAMPEAEVTKLAGFSRDANAARQEATRLLREAGVPDGWSFTLKNRDVPMPYEPVGVFLVDQWRRIGLNVTHLPQETGAFTNDLRGGDFDASVDFNCDFMDEPDLQLGKFLSANRSPGNFGRYNDPVLDDLFDRQSREQNPDARKQLVWQYERHVVDQQVYALPVVWWQRIVPHSAKLRGWEITPSHYVNQDLSTVWLAP